MSQSGTSAILTNTGISTSTMETNTTNTTTTTVPDPPEEEDDSFDEVEEVDMTEFNADDHADAKKAATEDGETAQAPPPRRAPPRPSLTRSGRGKSSLLSVVPTKLPKNLQKWPRCHACCFGVFIPLNIIVTISLVVGLVLGKVEMQEEVNGNDSYMRLRQAEEEFSSDLDKVFVDQLPTLCLGLFQLDVNTTKFEDIFETIMTNRSLLATYMPPEPPSNEEGNDTSLVETELMIAEAETEMATTEPPTSLLPPNKTAHDMASFFSACGQAGSKFRDYWLNLFVEGEDADDVSLTFNYIRCVNRSSPLAFNLKIFPSQEDVEAALPATQAEVFAESWKQNQQKLQAKYLEDEEKAYTELEALTKSFEDATGEAKCAVNMPAAAWFWFTVMSTVGYGNAVPKTVLGRLITFTLGFVSILMFGGMLGTAGAITTVLMNDFVHRFKKNVTRLRMVLVWGCLWMLWMLVIAHQAMSYKETRLQEEFAMNDAYWLAYISTTTVGFGDYYMEPEGLFIADLLGLWGNFLIGFVFLSALLTELSNLLGSVAPDLSGELQKNLKYAYDDRKVPEEIIRRRKEKRDSKIISSTTTTTLRNESSLKNLNDSTTSRGSTGNKKGWSHPVLRNRPQKKLRSKSKIFKSAPQPSTTSTSTKSSTPQQPQVQAAKPTIINEQEDNTNTNVVSTPTATSTTTAASPNVAAKKEEEEKKRQQQQQQAEQQKRQQEEQEKKRKADEAERQRQAQAAAAAQQKKQQQQQQQQQQPAKPAAAAPPAPPAAATPTQRVATFVNTGADPTMAKAELYYKTTRWGSLGHGDPPVSVRTYPGDDWYIVANGVYAKVFKISGDGAQQKFTI